MEGLAPPLEHLPRIRCSLSLAEVSARAADLARKGKLPSHTVGPEPYLFSATLFGQPLDFHLRARALEEQGRTIIEFSSSIQRKIPVAYWAVTLLSIWPGVTLTDSMLKTYFTSYTFSTWMWYLPLTIIPAPWIWNRMLKTSRHAAAEHALELIQRLNVAFEGTIETRATSLPG